MNHFVPAVLAAAIILGSVGCGRGAFTRQTAVDSFLEANPESTPEQAGCVVDGLIDRYGLADLEAQLGTDSPEAAFEEDQFREMFLCGVEGDVRDQLAAQLAANGIDEADAPCVADALVDEITDDDIDVLLSGEITPEFSDKFYDALEACDAL